MTFTLTLKNPKTKQIFSREFESEYSQHFNVSIFNDVEIEGPYEEEDLDVIQDIMKENLGDPVIWKRSTRGNDKNPDSIVFELTEHQNELLRKYAYNEKLSYLWLIGEIFIKLNCDGMISLISQFLADQINGLDQREIDNLFDFPMETLLCEGGSRHPGEDRTTFF